MPYKRCTTPSKNLMFTARSSLLLSHPTPRISSGSLEHFSATSRPHFQSSTAEALDSKLTTRNFRLTFCVVVLHFNHYRGYFWARQVHFCAKFTLLSNQTIPSYRETVYAETTFNNAHSLISPAVSTLHQLSTSPHTIRLHCSYCFSTITAEITIPINVLLPTASYQLPRPTCCTQLSFFFSWCTILRSSSQIFDNNCITHNFVSNRYDTFKQPLHYEAFPDKGSTPQLTCASEPPKEL